MSNRIMKSGQPPRFLVGQLSLRNVAYRPLPLSVSLAQQKRAISTVTPSSQVPASFFSLPPPPSRPLPIPLDHGFFHRHQFSDGADPTPPQHKDARITDHEYQVRVGKACRILTETLPDFMQRGAVDLDDLELSGSDLSSDGGHSSYSLARNLFRRPTSRRPDLKFTSIYHPSICFCFHPPLPQLGSSGTGNDGRENGTTSASSPVGSEIQPSHHGPAISFKGRTIYVASSHILRHALSALFFDTLIHIESASFEGRPPPASKWSGIVSLVRRSQHGSSLPANQNHRPDALLLRIRFEGVSRVSTSPHSYTVLFRYEFDRDTGTVIRHVVDNIQPVPGAQVWAGLTSAWGTPTPYGGGVGGGAGGAASTGSCPATGGHNQSSSSSTKASRTTASLVGFKM